MIRQWTDPRDGRRWRLALDLPDSPGQHAHVLFRIGRLELVGSLQRHVDTLKQLSDEEIIAVLDAAQPSDQAF